MISRFWWLNFALSVILLLLVVNTIMIWQKDVVIPPAKSLKAGAQWPDPPSFEISGKEKSQYDTIVTKNLYNAQRREHTPKAKPIKQPFKKTAASVEETAKQTDFVHETVDTLEKKDLKLFGIMIMEDYKLAFVNDMVSDEKNSQVRVRQKDIIGDYTIEKILPDRIIVSYQKKKFKVPLFSGKEDDKKVVEKTSSGKESKISTAKKRIVSITNEKNGNNKSNETIKKGTPDEDEWVILNTPFGKKRIKRKK